MVIYIILSSRVHNNKPPPVYQCNQRRGNSLNSEIESFIEEYTRLYPLFTGPRFSIHYIFTLTFDKNRKPGYIPFVCTYNDLCLNFIELIETRVLTENVEYPGITQRVVQEW